MGISYRRFTSDLDNILQALNESMIQVLVHSSLPWSCDHHVSECSAGLDNSCQHSPGYCGLVVIVRLARKYTNLQQKEVGRLNAYMDETISGQKAVIVQACKKKLDKRLS